jgi:hypothetical protein
MLYGQMMTGVELEEGTLKGSELRKLRLQMRENPVISDWVQI